MTKLRLLLFALLCFGAGALGCSKANPNAPAKVSGTLTYKGQPIKAGTLAFHTPEGVSYSGQISPDGTYSGTDLPTGELIVTVETEHLNPSKKAGGAEMERRMKMMGQQKPPAGMPTSTPEEYYIKIPSKYANPKTSPLTVTLSPGRQVKNLELTD